MGKGNQIFRQNIYIYCQEIDILTFRIYLSSFAYLLRFSNFRLLLLLSLLLGDSRQHHGVFLGLLISQLHPTA